jgi:hypothetical protein
MPGFPDTTGATDPFSSDAESQGDLMVQLARSGLRRLQVRHRIQGGRLGPGVDIAHRPADYARRIAMVVLPSGSDLAARAGDDWTAVRGRINATLARVMDDDTRVIAIIAPRDIAPGQGFAIVGDLITGGRVDAAPDPDIPAANAVNRVLGHLSATLISAVVEAVDAG